VDARRSLTGWRASRPVEETLLEFSLGALSVARSDNQPVQTTRRAIGWCRALTGGSRSSPERPRGQSGTPLAPPPFETFAEFCDARGRRARPVTARPHRSASDAFHPQCRTTTALADPTKPSRSSRLVRRVIPDRRATFGRTAPDPQGTVASSPGVGTVAKPCTAQCCGHRFARWWPSGTDLVVAPSGSSSYGFQLSRSQGEPGNGWTQVPLRSHRSSFFI